MIVYANEFYLSSDNEGLDKLKGAIKHWLDKKIGSSFRSTLIIPFLTTLLWVHWACSVG